MDKYEFKLKIDEMKALVSARNYNAAAEIAETISWRKIRNLNALVLAGEVFEQVGRYEESKEILLMAYDKSPIGRNIIYRLAEIAIKTQKFDEAQEYYDEFVDIAPHDNLKYVLKYKMTAAQGLPYKEQIKILEELKEQEYSEEWAYELAYLYHKDMQPEKCVEACDELILWFGDGIYVEKALELKMHYQPLSKPQEEKYRMFRQKRTGVIEVRPEETTESEQNGNNAAQIPPVEINAGSYNTQNLQEEIAKGMQQIAAVKMRRQGLGQKVANLAGIHRGKNSRQTQDFQQQETIGQQSFTQNGQFAQQEAQMQEQPLYAQNGQLFQQEAQVQGQQIYAQNSQLFQQEMQEQPGYGQNSQLFQQEMQEQPGYGQNSQLFQQGMKEQPEHAQNGQYVQQELYGQQEMPYSAPQFQTRQMGQYAQQEPQMQYAPQMEPQPDLQQEPAHEMTFEEIQAEWERTKQAMQDALQEAEEQEQESTKERSLEEAEQLMQRLLSIIPLLEQGTASGELTDQGIETEGQQPVQIQNDLEQAGRIVADMNQILQDQIDSLMAGEKQEEQEPVVHTVSDPTIELPHLPEEIIAGKENGVTEKIEMDGNSLEKDSVEVDNPVMSAYKEAVQPGISAIDLLQRVRMGKTAADAGQQLHKTTAAQPAGQAPGMEAPRQMQEEIQAEAVQKQAGAPVTDEVQQMQLKAPGMEAAQQMQAKAPGMEAAQQMQTRAPGMEAAQQMQAKAPVMEAAQQMQTRATKVDRVRQMQAGAAGSGMEAARNIPSEVHAADFTENMRIEVPGNAAWGIPPEIPRMRAAQGMQPDIPAADYGKNVQQEAVAGTAQDAWPEAAAEPAQDAWPEAASEPAQDAWANTAKDAPQDMWADEAAGTAQDAWADLQAEPSQDLRAGMPVEGFVRQQAAVFTETGIGKNIQPEGEEMESRRWGKNEGIEPEYGTEQADSAYFMKNNRIESEYLPENRSGQFDRFEEESARIRQEDLSAVKEMNAEPEYENGQENLVFAARPRFLTQAQLQAESVMDVKKDAQTTKEFSKEAMAAARTTGFYENAAQAEGQDMSEMKTLTPEQKQIFSYFVPIAGMEAQIYDLINGVSEHLQYDKHALSGNIIIEGISGSGKTVLIMDIVKALQKEIKRPSGKTGKIDANALNQKDLEVLIEKVSGGCLIIESAGKISRETAVKLSRCMEQDHSGTLYILEDTEEGIQKALERDSSFASKFTEKISIPLFSLDELVAFGKAYANDLDYDIDEMGVLALYKRIGNIQKLDHITTLTEVKEIVDEAIDNAEKGVLKKVFGILTATRANDDNYVILREKDFEE